MTITGPSGPSGATDSRLFVSLVSTPPGMPWEQRRAAALEARLSSPLPGSQTAFQLVRRQAWRPRSQGLYAIVYARLTDIGAGRTVSVEIDGRTRKLSFPPPGQPSAAPAGRLTPFVLIVGLLVLSGAVAHRLIDQRAAADLALSNLERRASAALRQAVPAAQARRRAAALDAAGAREMRLSGLLGSLAFASQARRPEAKIEAFRWNAGIASLDVAGAQSPLNAADVDLETTARPGGSAWSWRANPAGREPVK